MKTHFYDIESLSNVFSLCNFKPEENSIDVYILCDDPSLMNIPNFEKQLLKRILENNENFNGKIILYDLHEEQASSHLTKAFGMSDAYMVNDPMGQSTYPDEFRPVCDSDPDYDENIHPYLFGYNSYNYDTTMLAIFEHEVWAIEEHFEQGDTVLRVKFHPTTAKLMRQYNDELFSPKFKENMPSRLAVTYDYKTRSWSQTDYSDPRWRIRKNMLMTGRHLDVARLNEKQQKVSLKRILGQLGYQIKESNKLKQGQDTIENTDQLLDLIAYNVSDIVNLDCLFNHPTYKGNFVLKKGLLTTYPELIYDKQDDAYKPDIRPEKVRRDRLTIDSSSAQLSTKALCPYGHLTDIPAVSFLYPAKEKAEELGIPQVNVLEESRKFFYSKFPQPELRAKFDVIYNYYKSIEGRNFNESKNYDYDYRGKPNWHKPESITSLPKIDTNLIYYNADGSPSSCFVNFSTGGIHGAEYNKTLYDADVVAFEEQMAIVKAVQEQYPNPIDLKRAKKVQIGDTEYPASKFLKTGSTLKSAAYKDFERNRPNLFKDEPKGGKKLNPKYVFTSADLTNHEDFTSYYPNLLRMMMAFFNKGLGYDRYAEIFDNKEKYGKLMKDETITKEEKDLYGILRNGTKLILNSASGAADATFESNIRMNNQIISMRIIGQLFSWRIGQAQTIAGAKITSTNTDGLFSVLEETLNNQVLEKESADIGVAIEPEPTYLISKDSNNRIEMDHNNGKIVSASGGTLAARKGPNPEKSLAHPAIIDWALAEYLVTAAMNQEGLYGDKYKDRHLSLHDEFDDNIGRNILLAAKKHFDTTKFLQMFQNVIASSPGSITYVFGTTDNHPETPIIMQHYNRVFIMKNDTPNTMHLYSACARKLTPAIIKKRKRDNARPIQHDTVAKYVLSTHGVSTSVFPPNTEAVIKKITNIETDWFMKVENRNLSFIPDNEKQDIIDNLDYEKYLQLLRDCYKKNWQNRMPGDPEPVEESEDTDDTTTTVTKSEKKTATEPVISQLAILQQNLKSDLNNCLAMATGLEQADQNQTMSPDYGTKVRTAIQTAIDTI